MEDIHFQQYIDMAVSYAIAYGPKLILALLTLFIGLWLINKLLHASDRALSSKFDPTLTKFLHSLVSIGLKGLLIISVLGMVGVETTSFIAIIGAAGLAIGLALQGNLANFASGALILIFKPFRVGDVITAGGETGKVKEIQIFHTVLNTPDNKRVIIPNSSVTGGALTNFSAEPTRRVDMVFGIGYDDDLRKAKEELKKLVEADSRILKDPEPLIVVSELADSSVNFAVRVWVNSADYWGVYFDMHENVKLRFDEVGISIPYPQQDVHLHQAEASS
ncbi:MAG: mechanosensitive ion channel family protein [Gammaproteobacteria bacterium]|nr:MAG: mechanosensitive ion channel family protein [Gammaproteobacteria bacterium]